MKILILSCNMGEGHNTAGRAVYEKFCQMGVECDFEDALAIAGMKVSRAVNNTYVGITTSIPGMFGWIYSVGRAVSDLNTNTLHVKSPVYAANALYRKKLAAFIRQGGYDVAVFSHLFPAECLTSLRKHGMIDIPFVNIATDYTCIPFWEETKPDYFVIPHPDLAEDFSSKGIPSETLLPFGIPVSDKFKQKTDRATARRELGLPQDKPILLLMSGSMGFGHLEDLTRSLLRQFSNNAQIILLCGRNKAMRSHLAKVFDGQDNILLQPFTQQVALFMDAADMVFTKPGGLTSTEAAVKNTLLVHTDPIPGCETINVAFFGRLGLSVSSPEPGNCDVLALVAYNLWLDKDAQEAMLAAQRKHINPNAAEDICRFILNNFSN